MNDKELSELHTRMGGTPTRPTYNEGKVNDIHSCSYYCNRPECIKAQRDELFGKITQPVIAREWVGLTDKQFNDIYVNLRQKVLVNKDRLLILEVLATTEAKLKELNI